MPLKPHISNNVPPSEIRSRISTEFHKLLDDSLLRAHFYTVISFPGMRGNSTSIVDSKALEKALRKCPPTSSGILVVAHGFTAEAQQMLKNLNSVYFSDRISTGATNPGQVSVTSEVRRHEQPGAGLFSFS